MDTIESLTTIILKGTHDLKSERYQTAEELQKALQSLRISGPVGYQLQSTLPLSIPSHIAQYQVSEPPLHEVYGPELERMQKTLDDVIGQSSPELSTPHHVFGGSFDYRLINIKERDEKNIRLRKKAYKYAGWGVGLSAMLAGGIYLLGNYFPQLQLFPKTLWSTTSSTGVEVGTPVESGVQSNPTTGNPPQ